MAEQPPGPPAPLPPLWGGGSRAARPPPPPAGGRPHPAPGAAPQPRPNAYTWRGCAGDERGTGQRAAGRPPQRGRWGATARPPPPVPPPPSTGPQALGAPAPTPAEAEGMIPPPPGRTTAPGREAGAGPAPRPQPPARAGSTMDKRTRATTAERHTDRAQGQQASGGRSGMGATPSMARATPRTPALLPAQARQRDRPRQGDRRPTGPPGRTVGGNGARASPPTAPHPPVLERPRRADRPRGEHTAPSRVGRKRDRAAPPKNKPKRGTGAGHAEEHRPNGTALQAPSTGTARGARATPTRGGGGGADAAGARAHKHTKDTRGIPEEQPDRARGTHRLHGMTYQRARVRDPRTGRAAKHSAGHAGREGGNGEDTTPSTSPSAPNRPRVARTHNQGSGPAKAVVTRRTTHQPQG